MKDFNEAVKNGEVLVGISSELHDPVVTHMLGYGGFDFVIYNAAEGSACPYGKELETLITAAYNADIIPMVKVTNANYPEISKVLDLGALGVLVSIVKTREEAEVAADAAYFPPLGNRSANPEIRGAKYGIMPWPEYYEHANERITLMALLEDMQGVANMEDIMSVKGINAVTMAWFDLMVRLGGVGNPDAEVKVLGYQNKFIELCKKKGMPFMLPFHDVDTAVQSLKRGCRILVYPDDVTLLKNGIFKALKDVREGIKKFSG